MLYFLINDIIILLKFYDTQMILEIIVLTIFIATIFNIILSKFNIPTIIGYIITWIIISYYFWLQNIESDSLKIIAEFWIVFLMFSIWLEFSIKNLVKMKRNVFILWSMQFIITSIVFYIISITVFSLEFKEAIIISLWLSLSSTSIVLKILNENWEINNVYWKVILWILIFQDLMVIPVLLLMNILWQNDVNIPILIWKTFLNIIVLISILWVISKYLLEYFLYKVAKTKSNEIFIWSVLFIVIWASLLAHFLWFSYSLWAFIAWIFIADTHYKYQVEADLIPFKNLLLWLFFITVWIQLNLSIIFNNFWLVMTLLGLLILIKIVVIYLILRVFKQKKYAWRIALSLFQFWEFSIVIFEIASIKELINPWLWQFLIVIIIISMFITPFLLNNMSKIIDFIYWHRNPNILDYEIINKELKNHIILIWYWRLGKILWNILEENKQDFIIIENNIKTFRDAKKNWKQIIFWNAFQEWVLKSIEIEKAKTIFISIWNSEKLFLVADVVRKLNIKWNIIVKVNSFEEENILKDLNITNIIVETEKTALAMIEKL